MTERKLRQLRTEAQEWLRTDHNGFTLDSLVDLILKFAEPRDNCVAEPMEQSFEWHKLDWKKDFPDVDKLVMVRTKSGEEYICQTYLYYPTEDEIGYGSAIIQFEELNGDWVDDNEIGYWCYIEPFKESE